MSGYNPATIWMTFEPFLKAVCGELGKLVRPVEAMAQPHPPGIARQKKGRPSAWAKWRLLSATRIGPCR